MHVQLLQGQRVVVFLVGGMQDHTLTPYLVTHRIQPWKVSECRNVMYILWLKPEKRRAAAGRKSEGTSAGCID